MSDDTGSLIAALDQVAAALDLKDEVEAELAACEGEPPAALLRRRDEATYAWSVATNQAWVPLEMIVGRIARGFRQIKNGHTVQTVDDVVAEVVWKLLKHADTLDATTDQEAAAWARQSARHHCIGVVRAAGARPPTVGGTEPPGTADARPAQRADAVAHASGAPVARPPQSPDVVIDQQWAVAALPRTLELCTDQAVDLVETKDPSDLIALARSRSIGATAQRVRRNVTVWKLYKLRELAKEDVVAYLDQQLSPSSVSRCADRGMWGLECGRQRALRPAFAPPDLTATARAVLEQLELTALKDDHMARGGGQ